MTGKSGSEWIAIASTSIASMRSINCASVSPLFLRGIVTGLGSASTIDRCMDWACDMVMVSSRVQGSGFRLLIVGLLALSIDAIAQQLHPDQMGLLSAHSRRS